jgi:hypothetical protein
MLKSDLVVALRRSPSLEARPWPPSRQRRLCRLLWPRVLLASISRPPRSSREVRWKARIGAYGHEDTAFVTDITRTKWAPMGAKWGAIIGPRWAMLGMARRSKSSFHLLTSHRQPHWAKPRSSFASRESSRASSSPTELFASNDREPARPC